MIAFYVVDCETTGLNANIHEVCEISIIRCADKVQLTQFIICEYPENANYDSLQVTGKSIEDLLLGIPKEEAVDKIDKFLSEDGLTRAHRCFIGHNIINFDKKFIHRLYEKVGKELQVNLWLDTLVMMRTYAKENKLREEAKSKGEKLKLDLHSSCDMMGLKKFSTAHSSKMDTRNNYLLYKHLIENKNMDFLQFVKTFIHDFGIPDIQ